MQKPTVLLVANFLNGNRANPSVSGELALKLTAAGWQISTTSHVPHRLPRLLDMILTVWSRRQRYAVAHVEVYSGLAFIWAELVCLALWLAGKPYVLSLHGGGLPVFARRWPGRVRCLLRSARAVTVPSAYLMDAMSAYRADLRLLPNPVDVETYHFRLRTRPEPSLVWLRAFHHIYNPVLAVHVVASLVREFPDVRLTMIGPDRGDGSLQAAVRASADLGVVDRITFVGPVPKRDVPSWLNTGDIFLNTTNVDNTPISVIEAMACGLCVVSTDVGGVRYLLDHGHNALLVPPADPERFALAIQRIVTEYGLAQGLSRHARWKAEQFSWTDTLPAWERLLTDVAKGSGGRGHA